MLSSKVLEKCIELLAEINTKTNDNYIKSRVLSIGYTLKQELDDVSLIESMNKDINDRASSMGSLDTKRLLEDNIQLFNEKEKVLKQNNELKDIIDSKLQIYEAKLGMITNSMNEIKQCVEILNK